MPLVIDSPNQQSQDDINLPKVLKFIADNLPSGSQIIVGAEAEIEATYSFDKKIELERPYELLLDEEYNDVERIVEPLVKKIYDALQSENLK